VRRIPAWRLALALGLMLVSRLAVAGRWHVLLHAARAGISPGQSLRLTFAGLFAANFLPTTVGGDVVRLAGAVRVGVGAGLSAASLVVDRLVGMAGMAMTLPLGLGPFLGLQAQGEALAAYAGAAPLPLLGRLGAKAGSLLRKMLEAARLWARQPGALLLSLLFSWVHMLCTFSILALLFTGMGEHISLATTAGLYSLVYFVTLIPISINGYGLQELSLTYLFATLGGVSESSAISAALLFRTLMMLASLPGAAFLPGLLPGAGQPPAGAGPDGQPETL
jgi:uncharacterized membrane protein YbhN (UPF0104 family)